MSECLGTMDVEILGQVWKAVNGVLMLRNDGRSNFSVSLVGCNGVRMFRNNGSSNFGTGLVGCNGVECLGTIDVQILG